MKSRRLILILLALLVAGLVLALPVAATPAILYDGTVTLTKDAFFTKVAYNSGTSYHVDEDTPLGALNAAATTSDMYTDFTFDVTDKLENGVLLLDHVDGYLRKSPNYWNAYVNDVYKDGYASSDQALNLMEIQDGDKVEFYYAPGSTDPNDLTAVKAAATAAVLTVANVLPPEAPIAKFSATPRIGDAPLAVTFTDQSTGVGQFTYAWDFNNDGIVDSTDPDPVYTYATGGIYSVKLNVTSSLGSNSKVETNYITAIDDTTPWTLELKGAVDQSVTKSYFEQGLACSQSGHLITWEDAEGNTWSGIPLWLLAAMVDDVDPHTPDHFNFRDDLANLGYTIKITAADGYTMTVNSADIARNDGWIVANKVNDATLPYKYAGKTSWPLHLKGPAVETGNNIGAITKIELLSIPTPPSNEWTLKIAGDVTDIITQSEFEEAVTHGHTASWTDTSGNVYAGVPLWYLVGVADNEETEDHWNFDDTLAATNYSVQVIATDGFTGTFYSVPFMRSNDYIVANTVNGGPIPDMPQPLRMVGNKVTSGKLKVTNITEIRIPSLLTPVPAEGSYNLTLSGKISDVLSKAEFDEMAACPHHARIVSVTDKYGNQYEYSGVPLWDIAGWVDDRIPHGSNAFNAAQAIAGYTISVQSGTYVRAFASADVAWSDNYIVANMRKNLTAGETAFSALPTSEWPLRLVGSGPGTGSSSVGKIDTIKLTDFGTPVETPKLHIVKYAADRTTIVAETTIDYTEMMTQFDVIGDGVTKYSYQGVTMDPTDIWGQSDETKPDFKISNAVKGTRLSDLVELVGGMGVGSDLILVASDGRDQALPYSSIYPTPEIFEHQGDAILAWYADGKYVPQYTDGMRNFFMPADHVYGQWDMHESMPPSHWHYYYQAYDAQDPEYGQYAPGVLYPSAAGTSNKYVTELRVYTEAETPWDLQLDGTRVGGIAYTVNKGYFEAALACQMGANHEATYTDSKGNTWIGMPLWFLAGFVDDADQHSSHAYNQTLAETGYDIVVIGSQNADGTYYTKVFDSVPTIRSNNFIVANTKNGAHILDSDTTNWPLKLVGSEATGGKSVGGIHTIILNLRPVIDAIDTPLEPTPVSSDFIPIVYFRDPFDTHTSVFDWGDGATSAGVVDEQTGSDVTGSVTGTHAYAAPGVYTVTMTLTDSMGATASITSAYVVVYDPSKGEASGSGFIMSPVGAYTPDQTVDGKASFSLTAKYNKGVPSGNANLILEKVKSKFTSSYFDWITIANGKAIIHGYGNLDKADGYSFLLVVTDGGKTGSDTYRMIIWDSTGDWRNDDIAPIYDNGAGAVIDPAAEPIAGGSIVIK